MTELATKLKTSASRRTSLVSLLMLTFVLTGCGETDVSCTEFNSMSQAAQRKVMTAWEKDHGSNALGSLGTDADVMSMSAYCSQPGHAEDKIMDLTYTGT